MSKEELSIVRRLTRGLPRPSDEHLPLEEQDYRFLMLCNGYPRDQHGWKFDLDIVKPLIEEFKGTRVSFFGPTPTDEFFSGKKVEYTRYQSALRQLGVLAAMRKYRNINEDQAARIAFLFGGIVRHFTPHYSADAIAKYVNFTAQMTALGERKSGEAIASAMAMYIISGGELSENKDFTGRVYRMTDAIRKDPVVPRETKDLGLSQVARLKAFVDVEHQPFPDISQEEEAFEDFPTVGAEFHFPADTATKQPTFWQRLAIFNMSQYQKGSYIQLSRNDRDVIEVRMNPSIYPVTIANWNHLRLLLPELNRAFFTITLNRPTQKDFHWSNNQDADLVNQLRALGMLIYAGVFTNVPHTQKQEEIDFGSIYLGQTVKMHDGKYKFTGSWTGEEGQYGQMGIYAGFGDNFPYLAYYPSIVLANPNVLGSHGLQDFLLRIRTLHDALAIRSLIRKDIFRDIQRNIQADGRLNNATIAGNRIMELLNP